MPGNSISIFTDPHLFASAIHGAEVEIFPTTKGAFRAELITIDLGKIRVQHGRESLSRISVARSDSSLVTITFLADEKERPITHCGVTVSPGNIVIGGTSPMHERTEAPCRWVSMSLASDDLVSARKTIDGCRSTVPPASRVGRPNPLLMSRLWKLHKQAERLARSMPGRLAHGEVSHALAQALLHAQMRCLTDAAPVRSCARDRRRSAIIARFEEFLATNHHRPAYLAEICAATRVSERTLRVCCQEYLGMGPVHYLWLRRMYLARRALICADAEERTVTEIATDYGFWELGRFSIEYRALFGEPPSVTLRRLASDRKISMPRSFPSPAFALAQ